MAYESHTCSTLVPAETGLLAIPGSRALDERKAHGLTIHWPEGLEPAPAFPLAVLNLVSRGYEDPQALALELEKRKIARVTPEAVETHLHRASLFYGAVSLTNAVDLAIGREDIPIQHRPPERPLPYGRRAIEELLAMWRAGETEAEAKATIRSRVAANLADELFDCFGTSFLPAIIRSAHEIGLLHPEPRLRRSDTTVFALTRQVEGGLGPKQTVAIEARASGHNNAAAAAHTGVNLDAQRARVITGYRQLHANGAAHAVTIGVLVGGVKLAPQEPPSPLPAPQEIVVAACTASGMDNQSIANHVGRSVNTVKSQRRALAIKLGTRADGQRAQTASTTAAMWRTNLFVAAELPKP